MPNTRQETYDEFIRQLEAGPYWARITSASEAGRLKDSLAPLTNKYRGVSTGDSFVLLHAAHAHDFLSALEMLGIAVMGCDHYEYRLLSSPVDENKLIKVDGRYYAPYPGIRINQDGRPEYLTEILDGGSNVGPDILLSAQPVSPSIRTTQEHIRTNLPPGVEFVDIGLVIPGGWLRLPLLYSGYRTGE